MWLAAKSARTLKIKNSMRVRGNIDARIPHRRGRIAHAQPRGRQIIPRSTSIMRLFFRARMGFNQSESRTRSQKHQSWYIWASLVKLLSVLFCVLAVRMWSVQDILKHSPTKSIPTPPPSPVEHPSRFARSHSCIPGMTPHRPRSHPYSRMSAVRPSHLFHVSPPPPTDIGMFSPESMPPTPRQPLQKLPHNSLPPPTVMWEEQQQRFGKPSHSSELNELCKPYVPPATRSNNTWATGVFRSWVAARNANVTATGETFPADLLDVWYPAPVIGRALAAFIIEARRTDGNHYPGNTLKRTSYPHCFVMKEQQDALNLFSFVEKASWEKYYPQLHNAFDRQLHMLCNNGIGLE